MLAAEKGMSVIIRRLLQCHVSVTPVDGNGQTALHYALMFNCGNEIICRASQNSTSIICQLLNLDSIPHPEEVTKDCWNQLLILFIGIQSSKVNVDLIRCTFNSTGESISLLDNCEESLKAFIIAVLNNIGVQSYEQFIEEVDVL